MSISSIEWTDRTWNPVRGCTRVSEGCRNCYAERFAARNLPEMRDSRGKAFAQNTPNGPRWTGRVELVPSKLDEPLSWRKPSKVFVNSMSDLFHESLPFGEIARVLDVVVKAKRHTFQVLTKRPQRALDLLGEIGEAEGLKPPANLWLGVSVEDQKTADERIPLLLQTPAAKRFVSYEPALGPVDFSRMGLWLCKAWEAADDLGRAPWCPKDRSKWWWNPQALRGAGQHLLDWIIVGGESGPGARPFEIEWARETVRQCKAAGVAVFVKQLGSVWANSQEAKTTRENWDIKGGESTEWPADLRIREFPVIA